ncbi:hypothetical protein ACQPXH_12965 [Nocardia sp. CA-135953]
MTEQPLIDPSVPGVEGAGAGVARNHGQPGAGMTAGMNALLGGTGS